MTEPQADGRDQTRFGMVVWPEQNKYSAALNIFYADLTRLPSVYVFTPSNRHVTQLSSASRRSEEHTSELQSHLNLVCRLLLEKKKTIIKTTQTSPSYTTSTQRASS